MDWPGSTGLVINWPGLIGLAIDWPGYGSALLPHGPCCQLPLTVAINLTFSLPLPLRANSLENYELLYISETICLVYI